MVEESISNTYCVGGRRSFHSVEEETVKQVNSGRRRNVGRSIKNDKSESTVNIKSEKIEDLVDSSSCTASTSSSVPESLPPSSLKGGLRDIFRLKSSHLRLCDNAADAVLGCGLGDLGGAKQFWWLCGGDCLALSDDNSSVGCSLTARSICSHPDDSLQAKRERQAAIFRRKKSEMAIRIFNEAIQKAVEREMMHSRLKIRFVVCYKAVFKQNLYICGSLKEFGEWNPFRALPMKWSYGDFWTSMEDVLLPRGVHFEYKYIIKNDAVTFGSCGNCDCCKQQQLLIWEGGSNHYRYIELLDECAHSESFMIFNDTWHMDCTPHEGDNVEEESVSNAAPLLSDTKEKDVDGNKIEWKRDDETKR